MTKSPILGLLFCVACGLSAATVAALETSTAGAAVDLDSSLAPVPVIKANTLFKMNDGEKEWSNAYTRATSSFAELGVQPQRFAPLMQDGFRRIRNFRTEIYSRDAQKRSCELSLLIGAKEAWVEKDNPQAVHLRELRIVFFVSPRVMNVVDGQTSATARRSGPSLPPALRQSRFVVTAQRGTINVSTGEGYAFQDEGTEKDSGVRIQIFSMAPGSQPMEPMGELSCPGLHWRAWTDPRTGVSEIALRAASNDAQTEPTVRGRFVTQNPETKEKSEMEILAQGMVFFTSILDHTRQVRDEEGGLLGVTNVVQRRVLFHREIGVRIDGSGSAPLIPFQQAPEPAYKQEAKKKKPAKPGGPPSRTVVVCKGPAILDLAAPPRTLPPGPEDRVAPLAMRFVFLNGVDLHKFPLGPPAKGQSAGTKTELRCRHLCFQFPPDVSAALPEYAEAMGGVTMKGTRAVTETGSVTPFRIDCQRVYFDGVTDATVIEGVKGGSRLEIVDEMGELYTQSCVVSRKTQTLYMPHPGPKRAVVRGARKAVPEKKPTTGAALDFGSGDLVAEWHGTFRREIVPILASGNAEMLKEILLLDKDVTIQQAQKGLRIEGQSIRIVRDATSGQVERLEGLGGVLVRTGNMQVKGERVTVDLRYGEKGEITQNTVIVWSPPELRRHAVLWQGQSAARGERFVIDALNNNFQAYGGVVARFNLPQASEKKGAEAAGGAALIPGFSGDASGTSAGNRLALQCDGDFEFNGASGQLRVTRNVLIRQEGLSIVADGMLLTLAPPKKEEKDGKKENAVQEAGLFSASVKSIECRGRVEITSPKQVVHSDRLLYDIASELVVLEMDEPQNKVRVYLQDSSGGTRLLEVTRRLDYNAKDGVFSPAERMLLMPYKDIVPLPRQTVPPRTGGQQP